MLGIIRKKTSTVNIKQAQEGGNRMRRCRLPNRQEDKVVSSVDLLFSIKMVK